MLDSPTFSKRTIRFSHSFELVYIIMALVFVYGLFNYITTFKTLEYGVRLTQYFSFFYAFINNGRIFKFILNDRRCAGSPNSVSGFTFISFYSFIIWLVEYINTDIEYTTFHKIFFFMYESLCLINFTATYIGSYHTYRQILYGFINTALGLITTYLFGQYVPPIISIIITSAALIASYVISLYVTGPVDFSIRAGNYVLIYNAFILYKVIIDKYY